jgi:hypothetical protein
MVKRIKKKMGAPKGNKNAVKQDYYLKEFEQSERLDLENANGVEGIDAEIALLRHEIKMAISGGDERNLLLLVKSAGALERLVRTRYRISNAQHDGLKEGVGILLKEFLAPLGVTAGSALISKMIGK